MCKQFLLSFQPFSSVQLTFSYYPVSLSSFIIQLLRKGINNCSLLLSLPFFSLPLFQFLYFFTSFLSQIHSNKVVVLTTLLDWSLSRTANKKPHCLSSQISLPPPPSYLLTVCPLTANCGFHGKKAACVCPWSSFIPSTQSYDWDRADAQ